MPSSPIGPWRSPPTRARHPTATELERADYKLRLLTTVVTRLLLTVGFLRLRYEFDRARHVIVLALVAATAGGTAYAWATTGL